MPEWARAYGSPVYAARIRSRPADFDVTEILDIDFSGDGEHDFLYVEKVSTNTDWLARRLAQHAGVPARDVGYSGLKDRHAITRQWFSVPRWNAPDWNSFTENGIAILRVERHARKLRRGTHRKNRFRIVLRSETGAPSTISARLDEIRQGGVPNYFGPQRFGRDGNNLRLADRWSRGARLSRAQRSLAISTVRSFLFNEMLANRVADGTWNRIVDGDVANLDGSGSVFPVPFVDAEIRHRAAELDIHPAGLLIGENVALAGDGQSRARWLAALTAARVKAQYRSLRAPLRDLSWQMDDECLTLDFTLGRGQFATSVLREIVSLDEI